MDLMDSYDFKRVDLYLICLWDCRTKERTDFSGVRLSKNTI